MLSAPCRSGICRIVAALCAAFASADFTSVAAGAEADEAAFFREKIEPVLAAQCYECHSADAKDVQGGLRLDSKEGLRAGGDSGVVVVAASFGFSGGIESPPSCRSAWRSRSLRPR